MFPIRCATVVELRLQQMGDIYEKPHFTMENFKFREAVKQGLKFFAPNYQKAHPSAKSDRTNRLAYVAVTLFFDTIRRREKSTRESPLETRCRLTDVNTINLFKTRLDRFWANQDVKYDFTADLTGTGDRSVYEVYDTQFFTW